MDHRAYPLHGHQWVGDPDGKLVRKGPWEQGFSMFELKAS